MPHIFKSFRNANLHKLKKRKPKVVLDVDKMKPEKMATPQEIFGKTFGKPKKTSKK